MVAQDGRGCTEVGGAGASVAELVGVSAGLGPGSELRSGRDDN